MYTYWHWYFRQLLANAVLHDVPQVRLVIWFVIDPHPAFPCPLADNIKIRFR